MGNKLKWVLVFALLSATLLGISACGGSGGGDKESSSAKPSDVSGTVTVWDPFEGFPEYAKSIKSVDDAFERAYPNVTVDHIGQPFENYEALLQAAFTGREGPDVMLMSPANLGVLRWKNGL